MTATAAETTNWPKHPDGTNKRVGDMTDAERRAVIKASNARVLAKLAA